MLIKSLTKLLNQSKIANFIVNVNAVAVDDDNSTLRIYNNCVKHANRYVCKPLAFFISRYTMIDDMTYES